jgi:macrolide-specific efflux system membrane fusion protein
MRTALLVVVVLAIVAILLGVFSRGGRSEANDTLATVRARKETLVESTVAIGVVRSQVGAEVKVGSRLSGVVAKLRVNVGDRVTKGDVLARLDDAQWRARVASLEAESASAAAELEYARADLWRMEHVPAFSVAQVDNARRNLRVREASLGQVRARLEEARIQLGYTIITAPISGTVASVSTYEGETVAADFTAPTFVTILDQTRLEVQAFVDEHDIGKVHVGQLIRLRVDAFVGSSFDGRVRTIYPKAQLVNNVVNYVVIIDIAARAELQLRPEMTAHVDFILERKADVVTVPPAALLRESGRSFVVVQAGRDWTRREVDTGLSTVSGTEIRSGLRAGELVLADPVAWWKQKQEAM